MLQRVTAVAEYMLDTNATVRACAHRFNVSKTTVHKDVTERLRRENPGLYAEIREILAKNKAERHIRGGEATRLKYQKNRERESNSGLHLDG
jgi:putative DeoR family transcriptional regulator (stage III sporulation protein D)